MGLYDAILENMPDAIALMTRGMTPHLTSRETHQESIKCLQVNQNLAVLCLTWCLISFLVLGMVRPAGIIPRHETYPALRAARQRSYWFFDSGRTVRCFNRTDGGFTIQLFHLPLRLACSTVGRPFRQPLVSNPLSILG